MRHALLGGLALLLGRVAVLPVLNCSGVEDGFLQPGALPSRPARAEPSPLTLTTDPTVNEPNPAATPDRQPCRYPDPYRSP